MKTELDEALCAKYPEIFKLVTSPGNAPHYAISLFIFEHDDGWYKIIDMLCAYIQSHVRSMRQQRLEALLMNRALTRAMKGDESTLNRLPKWWRDQVLSNLEDLEPQCFPVPRKMNVVATQVKEKYGALRFYVYGADEYVHGLIQMAEAMSMITCETCGAPGKERGGGWIRTLCDEHAKEQGYYSEEEENG